jgi:hypothetical protein
MGAVRPAETRKYFYIFLCRNLSFVGNPQESCAMTVESGEISNTMVIGIGVVLFVVIVGIWYVVLR